MHEHDTTTVDLKTFPALSKSADAVRGKIDEYLKRMADIGKAPARIALFASDYDSLVRAIQKRRDAAYRDSGNTPPLRRCAGLWRHSRNPRSEGLSHAP